MIAADGVLTSPGVDVVLDPEKGIDLDDLRKRVGSYAVATDYDGSLNVLRRRVGANLRLHNPDHRVASSD